MRRSRCTRAAVVAAALALSAGAAAAAAPPVFDGPTIKDPRPAPDLALRDQQGRLVTLSGQRGRVVLLTFLYTHCPDACPLTAEHLSDAVQELGAERTRVRILAVSVDPVGDTRRSVARFVASHRLPAEFHYLTGSRAALAPVWREYGVQSARVAGGAVDHTLYTLLLDQAGRGRVLYDSTARPAAIRHDVRLLLAGASR